jgi:hypothetical protein
MAAHGGKRPGAGRPKGATSYERRVLEQLVLERYPFDADADPESKLLEVYAGVAGDESVDLRVRHLAALLMSALVHHQIGLPHVKPPVPVAELERRSA